jgi:hypothetical protein
VEKEADEHVATSCLSNFCEQVGMLRLDPSDGVIMGFFTKDIGIAKSILSHKYVDFHCDPLFRPVYVKDPVSFARMKDYWGLTHKNLVCNPRNSEIKSAELKVYFQNELGDEANNGTMAMLSKSAMGALIEKKRYKEKTFLGFKSLYEVIIDAGHPLEIQIKYVRGQKHRVKVCLLFHVRKTSIRFELGQPIIFNRVYG